MKTDRYIKVVLTIIAMCLVWLSLGGPRLLAPAQAQTPSAQTTIDRPSKTLISGDDLAFRVDGRQGDNAPVGTLVVRLNGGWYTARQHFVER
jgi:hypothetical protein